MSQWAPLSQQIVMYTYSTAAALFDDHMHTNEPWVKDLKASLGNKGGTIVALQLRAGVSAGRSTQGEQWQESLHSGKA